jgi:hypothetical protein
MVLFSYAQKRIIRGSSLPVNDEDGQMPSFDARAGFALPCRIGNVPKEAMSLRKMLSLAVCAASLAALPASAALYKWTDANGGVVYGDTPPPGVKAERITVTTSPADPNAVRDMAAKDAELRKLQQQRADDAAKEQKSVADQNLLRRQCQQAAGRLRAMRQEGASVYAYDEKGEKVTLDEAGKQAAIAQNEKLMRDIGCTPAIQQQ